MKKFESKKKLVLGASALAVFAAAAGGFAFHKFNNVKAGETYVNGTILQGFEWNLTSDGSFWNTLNEQSDYIANAGFTAVWLPPAQKSSGGTYDAGYGVYDLYDYGEFNQKGTIRTKYGTKDQYLDVIDSFHENDMQVYADIVLNHRTAADETEVVDYYTVDGYNRNNITSGKKTGTFYSKFTFAGRGGVYSDFVWDASCFDGSDYEATTNTNGLYLFDGKSWDQNVSSENGNYDYLLGSDVDFESSKVIDELNTWGEWYVNFADLDGFRLDAVKHIDSGFYKEWVNDMREATGKELFTVGEFMSNSEYELNSYLEDVQWNMSLFDFPLHYKFGSASQQDGAFDMSTLGQYTLTSTNPTCSVTFVENHDTQPNRGDMSTVSDWFKPSAYTYILTRQEGYPCVFYGDYYGTSDGLTPSFQEEIDELMVARTEYAYGTQHDYMTGSDVIGWTREGDDAHKGSGLAALITDAAGGSLTMYVGTDHAGETWYDMTGNTEGTVTIGSDGNATFTVEDGSYSVWINKEYPAQMRDTSFEREVKDTVTIYFQRPYWWSYNEAGELVDDSEIPTVCAYIYDNGGYTNAKWPGEEMTYEGDGLYSLTMDGESEHRFLLFNDGGIGVRQSPYANNTGFTVIDDTYYDYNGIDYFYEKPSATEEPAETEAPTAEPTEAPTVEPTAEPTEAPTEVPTAEPTAEPTEAPTAEPTAEPTEAPTAEPTVEPTEAPTAEPTVEPTEAPTEEPTVEPTIAPTEEPVVTATPSPVVTSSPTAGLTIYYYTTWDNAYIHYSVNGGAWTSVPGVKLVNSDREGYKTMTIDCSADSTFTCCFNNGNGTWDNNNNQDYKLTSGVYSIKNNVVTKESSTVATATPAPTVEPTEAPTVAPTVEPTTEPTEAPTEEPVVTATPSDSVTVYYYTGWTNAYMHYRVGNGAWTTVPGVEMGASDISGYKVLTIDLDGASNITCCFNNGSGAWDNNNSQDYTLTAGVYAIKNTEVTKQEEVVTTPEPEITLTPVVTTEPTEEPVVTETPVATEEPEETETPVVTEEPSSANTTTIYYYTGWTNAYTHYRVGNGAWTTVPGVEMEASDVSGYKKITIDLGSETELTCCFNNGSGNWDSNNSQDYKLGVGTYTIKNTNVTSGAPSNNTNNNNTTSNKVTIYYATDWSTSYLHYQVEGASWTAVPGVVMSTSDIDGYKVLTVDLGSASSITCCFNNGSGSWDSKNGANYTMTTGTYTVENGSVIGGAPAN